MLLRIDGQDHYDTTYLPAKYTAVGTNQVTWTVTAEGPNGKHCLTRVSTGTSFTSGGVEMAPLLTQSGPWTPTTSGVCGFKVKVDDLTQVFAPGGSADDTNVLLKIGGGSVYHCGLQLNKNGTFTAIRIGVFGDVLGASTEGLQAGVWQTVELKWTISHTVGSLEVYVDRVRILNVQNVDTYSASVGAVSTWTSVFFLGCTAQTTGLTMRFCDVWIADQTGGANDVKDFLHAWDIVTLRPNGVGSSSGWTPLSGANWTNVDETPPTGDTDYVSTTTAGTRDMYQMEDLPTGSPVMGFQTVGLTRLTTAGSVGWTPSVRQGSTNYDATQQGIAATTYASFAMQPYDTNPATGVKATATEINAAEFGQVKSA